MNISIFNKDDFETNVWSGGTTTQLYISPASAVYAKRNFDVRISTASVSVKESSFTPLPGVKRKLMVLDGEMVIKHDKHYTKQLKSFEVDAFNGDWQTSAMGMCTDFNVMTRGQTESELSALSLSKGKGQDLRFEAEYGTLCLYLLSGGASIEINKAKLHLTVGDLLILEDAKSCVFPMQANANCQMVITKIKQ